MSEQRAHGTSQPFLHELVTVLRAPVVAISARDGQVAGAGVAGVYVGDDRVLSRFEVRVDGVAAEPVGYRVSGVGGAEFVGVLRALGDAAPDPTVLLTRRRTVTDTGLVETLLVSSSATDPVVARVGVTLGTDFAPLIDVKTGHGGTPVPAADSPAGLCWSTDHWTAVVTAEPAPDHVSTVDGALSWDVIVAPHGEAAIDLELTTRPSPHRGGFRPMAVAGEPPWSQPSVTADDPRLSALLRQGLDDARALLLADPEAPEDRFLAAGSPWFLTLFGRDSLWAARMLLPLGTELARGTLSALARRQGRSVNPAAEEEPGKILHEVRDAALRLDAQHVLPPVYYGTVDATPLWICLLVDAWRWGLPATEVERLLPACEAALGWLVASAGRGAGGFLEYVDSTGAGLGNQGWKDSGDSVQWSDGRLATAPLALCEVQGYAYQAAMGAADLLEAFGRAGSDQWREWAQALGERFRLAFWVEDATGPFPAIALDATRGRVDSLTSNIGHLLGTGILTGEESRIIAARLTDPTMDSGYGLRTLSGGSPFFGPMRYHGGSVWPHDTAIAITGLARSGEHEAAGTLLSGLLAAGEHFDYRLPELFSGVARSKSGPLLAYPASCRPQAWAATSAVALLQALLGLEADVPGGTLNVRPLAPVVGGRVEVRGLRVAGGELAVRVDGGGAVTVDAPAGLTIRQPAP